MRENKPVFLQPECRGLTAERARPALHQHHNNTTRRRRRRRREEPGAAGVEGRLRPLRSIQRQGLDPPSVALKATWSHLPWFRHRITRGFSESVRLPIPSRSEAVEGRQVSLPQLLHCSESPTAFLADRCRSRLDFSSMLGPRRAFSLTPPAPQPLGLWPKKVRRKFAGFRASFRFCQIAKRGERASVDGRGEGGLSTGTREWYARGRCAPPGVHGGQRGRAEGGRADRGRLRGGRGEGQGRADGSLKLGELCARAHASSPQRVKVPCPDPLVSSPRRTRASEVAQRAASS